MDIILQIVMIIAAVCFLIFILTLVNRSRLHLKYSLVWIIIAAIYIILALFPKILIWISNDVLQIESPVNALFLMSIVFALIITFCYVIILSKMAKKITILVQEVSLLKKRVKELESENEGTSTGL